MKIGVVGTGNMGRSLGVLLAHHGHDVFFGARKQEAAELAARLASPRGTAGTNQQAAEFGDVIIWSARGAASSEIVPDLFSLKGKPIIDLNNNPRQGKPHGKAANLSSAERLQSELTGANVVKAFNTLPMEVFEVDENSLRSAQVSVFLASDSAEAKSIVARLASQLGFTPIDFGLLNASGIIEQIGDLVRHSLQNGGSFFSAFSLVSLPEPPARKLGGRLPSSLR